MSVEELGVLHHRYLELSHRFRAAWVFHQFTQSLKKVFNGSAGTGLAEEFQTLYSELKEVSQVLTASESESTHQKLDAIAQLLDPLADALVEEDNRVTPQRMRQFFHRFQRYDDKILLQMARFSVYAAQRDAWSTDRIDKLDFLLTRISQQEAEGNDGLVLVERRKLREVFDSLWNLSGADLPLVRDIEAHQMEIDEIRLDLPSVGSFDDLNERGLLDRFRRLKHRLGPLLLEPDLLVTILETNLAFRNLVSRLYAKEERRIVADYQQVFELEGEGPRDLELDRELNEFRREIETFERQLQQDDFRIGDLARIRSRVRTLLPRLQRASRPHPRSEDPPSTTRVGSPQPAPLSAPPAMAGGEEMVAADMAQIIEALEDTDPSASSRAVSLQPAVFALRLEAREVLAYRRLHGRGAEADATVDRELEEFLLRGAALRVHLVGRREGLREALDDTYHDGSLPPVAEFRPCLRAAEEVLDEYARGVRRLLIEGRSQDARFVEISRIRLMSEYAGLWLQVYKPLLEKVVER